MGRISKRRIDPEIEDRIFEIFWEYLASLKMPLQIKEFLVSLLSQTEQVMLSKRLAIALLLSKGFNFEEIDETIKVSKSTVGMINRQMLAGVSGYQRAVEHILPRKKVRR